MAKFERALRKRRLRGVGSMFKVASDGTVSLRKGFGNEVVPNTLWGMMIRKDPCAYCGVIAAIKRLRTRDHIRPKAHGGTNHWTNLTGACEYCNTHKGAQGLLQFMLRAA